MTRDQKKFLNLRREKGGNINSGDDASTKIIGRETICPNEGKVKVENVWYVEDLKHNLLSSVIKDTLSLSILKNVK